MVHLYYTEKRCGGEKELKSLKQQHAAGQTRPLVQACPIEDQLLHFEEREGGRRREIKK